LMMTGAFVPAAASECPALLNHKFNRLQDDSPQNLCQYSGKVVLVVNTASYCGFTSQYEGLEKLYANYKDKGLVILGFPSNDFSQEPGNNKEIADFCYNTYGVKFPMLGKSHVRGGEANPMYVMLAKDKTSDFRLMGFGHRVYKNFDPRATILRKMAEQVLNELGINDPLLEIARNLEKVALEDDYFVSRKLYPNVDFYSGILYRAMGIPTNMFTVMFALGRLPGWLSHWREQRDDDSARIYRPRQVYTGATIRDYVALENR